MKIKYCLILLLCLLSCNRFKDKEEFIITILKQHGINSDYNRNSVVLVAPVMGCSTCIDPVKKFIRQVDNPYFHIIISCYTIKDFRFSFTEDELNNKSYVVDSTGQAIRYKLADMGAKMYFFRGQEILAVKRVSCTEPDLLNQTTRFLEYK